MRLNKMSKLLVPALALLLMLMIPVTEQGPIALVLCYSGCNALWCACYLAAGATAGTVVAPAAPPLILGCNTGQSTCMAACAVVAAMTPL